MIDRYSRHLSRLLVALPLLSLLLGAVAWLRYGFDLPWFDDWRGYAEGNIGSLNPSYLFREINDTMAPVGFALDALAQRFLDGNSVAYQFLSMTIVLGSLLLLQWKLLTKLLGSGLQAAACFSLTVLMLQPGSYWGMENLAYHQCLPLVFILMALWLVVCADRAVTWRDAAIPGLGLVAGFTYISGAFGVFAAGLGLLLVAACCHSGEARRRMLLRAGLFASAGLVAVVVQTVSFYVTFHQYGTHAGIPMALPTQSAFWMFYLGKIGRSLLLAPSYPRLSLAITIGACGVAIAVGVAVLRHAKAPSASQRDKRLAGIYTALLSTVFVYMLMVAAGRTNYRPAEMNGALDIFAHGFTRFHFFWATLLWPWVAASAIVFAGNRPWAQKKAVRLGGVMLILGAALAFAGRGAYAHMSFHRDVAAHRLPSAECLLLELQKGRDIRCPGLLPSRFADLVPNAYPAYLNAQRMRASFVRYFPLLPYAQRPAGIASFYEMAAAGDQPGLYEMEALGKGAYRAVAADPQMHFQSMNGRIMNACTTLDVDVVMKVASPDIAQVFFLPRGAAQYDEKYSVRRPVEGSGFETLSFRMESANGFQDTLRFDPVTRPQNVEIRDLRAYCVRER